MKARISPRNKLTKKEQDMMIDFAETEFDKQKFAFMRQILKIVCYVLNRKYGFGEKRLHAIVDEVKDTLRENRNNEIFWEQLDRVMIKELKMPFSRETTDKNGKAVFTDGDTEIFTGKKKA